MKFRVWDKEFAEMYKWETVASEMVFKDFYDKTKVFQRAVGLKDDSDNDIYEGDIVKVIWDPEDDENEENATILEINWFADEYRICGFPIIADGETYDCIYSMLDIEDYGISREIIGNIYENPELMEVK